MDEKKMLNGMELHDEELDKVSGGVDLQSLYNFVECKECGTTVQARKGAVLEMLFLSCFMR